MLSKIGYARFAQATSCHCFETTAMRCESAASASWRLWPEPHAARAMAFDAAASGARQHGPDNLHLFALSGNAILGVSDDAASALSAPETWVYPQGQGVYRVRNGVNPVWHTRIAPRLLCNCGWIDERMEVCEHLLATLIANHSPLVDADTVRKFGRTIFRTDTVDDSEFWPRINAFKRGLESASAVAATPRPTHAEFNNAGDVLLHPEVTRSHFHTMLGRYPRLTRIRRTIALFPEALHDPTVVGDILRFGGHYASGERIRAQTPMQIFAEAFRIAAGDPLEGFANLLSDPRWKPWIEALSPNDFLPLLRSEEPQLRGPARQALAQLKRKHTTSETEISFTSFT